MANATEQNQFDPAVRLIEPGDSVVGGAGAPINQPLQALTNRTLWLKNQTAALQTATAGKAASTTAVNAGNGLTGGGNLTASRTISLGQPGQITAQSQNAVQETGHTHAIDTATTSRAGIVMLDNGTGSAAEDRAATPKAVKAAYDKAVAAESAASGAVKTSGNQNVGGEKTFTSTAFFKGGAFVSDSVGDFNANQCLQMGANNVNTYFYNKRSGKYLSMRNDGELRYDGKRLLNADDLSGMVPSGAVMYFAGQTAPTGWLKANGAAVSRTAYAALFDAIGTTYGEGDGRTTFNLPDLRGEFMRGWDDGRGVDAGRVFGSMQGDAIRNITGQFVSDDYNRSLVNEMLGVFTMTKRNSSTSYDAASTVTTGGEYLNAIKFDASRVVPTAAENRPRNIALLACIKI